MRKLYFMGNWGNDHWKFVEEGKWLSSNEDVISYMDAGQYIGQTKTVEGTIVRTYKSSSAIFLNFHDPYQGYFFIVIFLFQIRYLKFLKTQAMFR